MEPWQIINAQRAIVSAQIRAMGMQAENDRRAFSGSRPPLYGEQEFNALVDEMEQAVDRAINPR